MSSLSTGASTGFATPVVASPALVPPLETGDRLSRTEFERRYGAMPDVKKAELIDGVVQMPLPVRFPQHGRPHSNLVGWLSVYEAHTAGVAAGDNTTLRLDNDNMPQPDALMMIEPTLGGQARLDAQGYIEGAPELVAEIASSSVSIDLHDKLRVYRRNGVTEYLVWRVLDRAIDWFALRDSQHLPLMPDNEGIARSEVFPGLWLNVPAMLEGRLDVVLATLQLGIETLQHQQFVAELVARRK